MPTSFESDLAADAADSSATGFVLAMGGWAHGTVSNGSDGDFIAVQLVAGQSYSFALVGINANGLSDPLLQLFAADGLTLLAINDNGLMNGNAGFSFVAATSGTHYLRVSGVSGATGGYAVAASQAVRPSFDAVMIAGLLDSRLSWSAGAGSPAALTFGFADTNTHGLTGFSQCTEAQKDAMRAALAQFSDVAGLSFTEVAPGGYTDSATLLYGNFADPAGETALGALPGSVSAGDMAGDVWINTALLPGAVAPTLAPMPGSQYFQMLLQEIGRSLGLSRPSDYTLQVDQTLNFADHADFAQDSRQYTVMSAFDASHTGASPLNLDTLGIFDILALQTIYGANSTTRATDTTYGFGSNAGQVYDFGWNIDPILTIWDGGGIDVLNVAFYSANQVIRLGEGQFSSIGGFTNNVGIAFGTTIENAIGGRGSDQIFGNAAVNLLQGRAGDDVIYGGEGHDNLRGGEGGDTLYGGTGNDTLMGDETVTGVAAPQVFNLAMTNGVANTLNVSSVALYAQSFTLELIWQQLATPTTGVFLQFGDLGIRLQADLRASLQFANAAEEEWLYDIIPPVLQDGQPHRLSISYNDGDGTLCVYIDGVRLAEHAFTPGTRGLSPAGDITISGYGAVGDIRLFSDIVSAQDIWDRAWITLPDPNNTPSLTSAWVGNGVGGLISSVPGVASFAPTGSTGHTAVTLQDQGIGNLMQGGAGDDTYLVRSGLDQVIEAAGGGNDHVIAHVSFALATGQQVETLSVATGANGISLTGNALANQLNSALDAADTLAGGGGDDVYHLYHAGDQVIEVAGAGDDTVFAHANFTLQAGSYLETLRAAGTHGLTLIGNSFANRIYSSASFADTLAGGAGNDSYYLYRSTDVVIEGAGDGSDVIYAFANYALAPTALVETLFASGSAGRNLTGNAQANVFHSNALHADTLAGGAGNDIYHLCHSGDRVVEASGGGTDVIYAYVNYTLFAGSAVEQIWAQGSTGLALQGNTLANVFYSNLARADTLSGGAGNDSYYVRHSADRVIEAANGGNDTIFASVNHTLFAGSAVEIIRSAGSKGLALSGNELANSFQSNALYADTLSGGAGNDTYHVRHIADRVIEAANGGSDTVFAYTNHSLFPASAVETLRGVGSVGLRLTGNALGNSISGTSGNDTLDGGAGHDTLWGGLGKDLLKGGVDTQADQFVFRATAESAVGTNRDTISGFASGIDDIDLRAIDANLGLAGNQAFVFGTQPLAFGVWSVVSGPNLLLRADVNGDKLADMEILLQGVTSVVRSDFLL